MRENLGTVTRLSSDKGWLKVQTQVALDVKATSARQLTKVGHYGIRPQTMTLISRGLGLNLNIESLSLAVTVTRNKGGPHRGAVGRLEG